MQSIDQLPLLDDEAIEEILAMARHSGKDVLGKFLQRARSGEALALSTLYEDLSAQRWEKLTACLHRIKGTAGMYGLQRLAALATQIHDRAKASTVETSEVEALYQVTEASLDALERRLTGA